MTNTPANKYRSLYWANIQMVFLCGLTAFWLLVSPLVPYDFDITRVEGMALFVAVHLLVTASLGAVGVVLNGLAARETRVTLGLVRAKLILVRVMLRRGRRR